MIYSSSESAITIGRDDPNILPSGCEERRNKRRKKAKISATIIVLDAVPRLRLGVWECRSPFLCVASLFCVSLSAPITRMYMYCRIMARVRMLEFRYIIRL
ncbi:hypothetical protein BYT27DRAFT_6946150 [Phlegmacium glaucopus]|nr:hypothetical protein BYT27DRAFT_6946150 [Phlegmacium glaucopus]